MPGPNETAKSMYEGYLKTLVSKQKAATSPKKANPWTTKTPQYQTPFEVSIFGVPGTKEQAIIDDVYPPVDVPLHQLDEEPVMKKKPSSDSYLLKLISEETDIPTLRRWCESFYADRDRFKEISDRWEDRYDDLMEENEKLRQELNEPTEDI